MSCGYSGHSLFEERTLEGTALLQPVGIEHVLKAQLSLLPI